MAKIAFISDIHGNYEALKYVLKDMEHRGVDKVICLGDIAFKYASPGKVLEAIRANSSSVIEGNVDRFLLKRFREGNSPGAKSDILKYGDNIDWLDNLPFFTEMRLNGHLIRCVHASPRGIERMYNPNLDNSVNPRYQDGNENGIINDPSEFFQEPILGYSPYYPDVVIFGHTHIPYIENSKYGLILNPGSIGDPVQTYYNSYGEKIDMPLPEVSYMIIEGKETELSQIGNYEPIKIDIIRLPYLKIVDEELSSIKDSSPILKQNKARLMKHATILKELQKRNKLEYEGVESFEFNAGNKISSFKK